MADEMKVDGTDDRYPSVPKPRKELVSCGVEIILDKERDDRYPRVPKPCKELVSCGDEIRFDGIFKLLNNEPSPTKRLLLIVVP